VPRGTRSTRNKVRHQGKMPISGTFVLGKKENYFFNTPTHWAW
jgi:hypothetical protein